MGGPSQAMRDAVGTFSDPKIPWPLAEAQGQEEGEEGEEGEEELEEEVSEEEGGEEEDEALVTPCVRPVPKTGENSRYKLLHP